MDWNLLKVPCPYLTPAQNRHRTIGLIVSGVFVVIVLVLLFQP